jgi:hypothetical protein
MPTATVVITDDGITLRTPYRPLFVEQFKAEIPGWARRWDPARKSWTVDLFFRTEVLDLCRMHFSQVLTDDCRTRQQQRQRTSGGHAPDWATELFAALPEHLHQLVYRALAKTLHPDIGGDPNAMKVLTAAYDKRSAA